MFLDKCEDGNTPHNPLISVLFYTQGLVVQKNTLTRRNSHSHTITKPLTKGKGLLTLIQWQDFTPLVV